VKLLAIFALAAAAFAADDPPPNQAANRKLSLEGTVIPKQEDVTKLLGVNLGEGYIVVRLRATPQNGEPLRLAPHDFTLISRKDGERSRAMEAYFVAQKDEVVAALEARAFPEADTAKPVEGLLYFHLERKVNVKDLGLIYDGPAGKMVIDFK
jgi:hypothetical protein